MTNQILHCCKEEMTGTATRRARCLMMNAWQMVVMVTAMVKLEVVAEVVEVAAGVPTVLVAKCGCS